MSKKNESKRPTHALYVVEGEGDKTYWNKIGAAWMHKDQMGANLEFTSFPLTGRVVLRKMKDQDGDVQTSNNGGQQ